MAFVVKQNQAASKGGWVVKGQNQAKNRSGNLQQSLAEAARYKQEADYANSTKGMAWNAIKAAPQATADVLVGTPAKFLASALEAPKVALTQQYTNKTYKIPGISPFKSFQSDFGDVETDVIEGRKGLGSAAWSLAQIPLAGLEMYGVGKGAKNVAKSGSILAKTPTLKNARNVALDVADTFLPTTRGMKPPSYVANTSKNIKKSIGDLEMQRLRAHLAAMENRSNPTGYRSGIKASLEYGVPQQDETVRQISLLEKQERLRRNEIDAENAARWGQQKSEYNAMKEADQYSGSFFNDEKDFQYGDFKALLRKFNKGKVRDELLGGDSQSIAKALEDKGIDRRTTMNMFYSQDESEDEVLDSFRKMFENEKSTAKFVRPERLQYPEESPELTALKKQYNEKIEAINRGDTPDVQPSVSGEIITPKINYRKFIDDSLGINRSKANTARLDREIAGLQVKLRRPEQFVYDLPVSATRALSKPKKLITSGGRVLRESGEGGIELEKRIQKQQVASDLLTGKYNKTLSEASEGLTKTERTNLTDVIEGNGLPINERVQTASESFRKFYDDIAKEAERRQFTIRTKGGDVPFKARENYAPRIYNFDDLTKTKRKEEMLQHLVETGQARNKAEAAKLFDDFIKTNAERRAGNLENPRLLDLPGYEKDALTAGRIYAERTARRFSEADAFGKKDEISAALIDKIANEGGDYQEAQRVFDMLYKGLPKNKIIDTITQFNLATKLDLGAITNLTQSANTVTKAGIANTVKAIIKGFGKEGRDIAEMANVYDDMVIVSETGIKMNKLVRGVMFFFKKVEQFNRRTAAVAGKLRAEELVNIIKKNPESAYAARQLQSLGLDPVKLATGKLTQKDILTAANKMAELTQFKPTVLNVPTAWRTPAGRLLMQFKSFAYMQTRFITDEILKEAKQGNVAPLLRFLMASAIISPLAYNTRNLVAQRDEYEPKRSLDTRPFDKYFGAGKSFYTEPITQGNFLAETWRNEYATPLKKVTRGIGSFAGPGIGEVGNTLVSLEDMANRQEKNRLWYKDHPAAQEDPLLGLKRQAVGSIPFVGEAIKNRAFGFEDTTAEKARKLAEDGLRTGDMGKVNEAIQLDPYLNNERVIGNIERDIKREKMKEDILRAVESNDSNILKKALMLDPTYASQAINEALKEKPNSQLPEAVKKQLYEIEQKKTQKRLNTFYTK